MKRLLIWLCAILLLILALFLLLSEPKKNVIKVGVLHSLTGTMAVSEKPVMQATLLAIEQINAQGGLLGHQLQAVVLDGQSDANIFAKQAEKLITQEHVNIIFGCWTSASRKQVKEVVEKHHALLVYPVQYEGLEQSPNIIYMGAAPNQQMIPALNWAMQNFGKHVYFVGSDYVFPHVAHWIMSKHLNIQGGDVVGEMYLPLGSQKVQAVLNDIAMKQPDVIINSINGDSNIAFFRGLKKAGKQIKDIPVVSLSVGESLLLKIKEDTVGHYVAWNYFQSIANKENKTFIDAYQARFHESVVSDPMQNAWLGVQLWAQAVQMAGSLNIDSVRQSISHQSIQAPEGIVSIDEQTQHAWHTVRIGQVQVNGQLKELWSSKHAVRPVPYPLLIPKREANRFLNDLYQGWHQHWVNSEGES